MVVSIISEDKSAFWIESAWQEWIDAARTKAVIKVLISNFGSHKMADRLLISIFSSSSSSDLHVLLCALEGRAVGPSVVASCSTRIIELDRRCVHGVGHWNEQTTIINTQTKDIFFFNFFASIFAQWSKREKKIDEPRDPDENSNCDCSRLAHTRSKRVHNGQVSIKTNTTAINENQIKWWHNQNNLHLRPMRSLKEYKKSKNTLT